MTYVEGFVLAVPADKKDVYRQHAADAVALFKEFGVTRHVEAWGDDVPKGETTDFQGAVNATDDEVVVFSWFEYPDKATRDAATEKMMSDPRMAEMGADMPFDGRRMIVGGFETIVDEGPGTAMGYVDGFLVPVTHADKAAYRAFARTAAEIFIDHGATRVVEAWGDGLTDGKVTDYRRAVKAVADENTVFSWVEWPDKATRDSGQAKVMADERIQHDYESTPFDGKRMIYGGFAPIVDA